MLIQLQAHSSGYCQEREGCCEKAGAEEAPAGAEAAGRAACPRGWKVHVSVLCTVGSCMHMNSEIDRVFIRTMEYSKLDRETQVSFSEELTGNFRTLKPKGNPLLDRFDSLHKRNKIEIGRPKKTRKAKVKIIEAKK
ncbi:unnamed protein product [Phytophthora fragariaefolia]|uniref:Ribosome biogenesis protein NOP53 n=1 Tax=Phytophthora fragariaefolia TaxID=1490495 RepID=A0A9W6WL98_9STRA|nr:unnamed protein product [Phytophthora fragariaefolia]